MKHLLLSLFLLALPVICSHGENENNSVWVYTSEGVYTNYLLEDFPRVKMEHGKALLYKGETFLAELEFAEGYPRLSYGTYDMEKDPTADYSSIEQIASQLAASSGDKVRKVIVNGKMRIVVGDKVYEANGNRIK